ncbi:MAG: tetratricopeptide repeat protein [Anaeromyxobacter sp.]|nr:tetratricopeptide repeat protein [Anaeromyxobacter sp.]
MAAPIAAPTAIATEPSGSDLPLPPGERAGVRGTEPPASDPAATQAARLLASADRLYLASRFERAAAEYRRALAALPSAPAHVGLARALYDASPANAAEALRSLDAALRLDARSAPAWLLRGVIHQGQGRSDAARAAYQRFLELSPTGREAAEVRQILEQPLR